MNEAVPMNNFNSTMAREIERKQKVNIIKSLNEIHVELKRLSDKIDSLESKAVTAKPSRAKKTEE